MGNQSVRPIKQTQRTEAPIAQQKVLAASKLANEIVKASAQSSRLRLTARDM